MKLPQLSDLEVSGKKVLLRADLDFDPQDRENFRLKALTPTLNYLKEKKAKITLIGHRGRPDGKVDKKLTLQPFEKVFSMWGAAVEENLRFDEGEEKNNEEFARKLSQKGEVYINEAFGNSHRKHASIVSLPKLLPHAAGEHFVKETENLLKVLDKPKRPVVALISGVKDDKITFIKPFKKFADKILIGGRLPEYIHDDSPLRKDERLVVANLVADLEDISIHSMEAFEEQIKKAGTIVVSGPIGKYEEEGHRQGTSRVLEAVVKSRAFKVAGGGDTLSALKLLGIEKKFDWISTGGGAMLDFLSHGTLPGIEALLD